MGGIYKFAGKITSPLSGSHIFERLRLHIESRLDKIDIEAGIRVRDIFGRNEWLPVAQRSRD
jgi:hypothetical protein